MSDLTDTGLKETLAYAVTTAKNENEYESHRYAVVKIEGKEYFADAAGTRDAEALDGELAAAATRAAIKEQREMVVHPAHFATSTISSVADYLAGNVEDLDLGSVLVTVSWGKVAVWGAYDIDGKRSCYLKAEVEANGFPFDRWVDPEQMVLGLLAGFEDTPDRAAILKMFRAGVKAEAVRTVTDDGTGQQVQTQQGTLAKWVDVGNPVKVLKPYRTFPEIEQPESPFTFRLRREGDNEIYAKIIPADGDRWKIEATASARAYLETRLEEADVQVAILS